MEKSKVDVSFIITAYKTQDYIEECLDSIEKQDCLEGITYEILVGVDSCALTLAKLRDISPKYPNIKVYCVPENIGTYVMRNSLVELSSGGMLFFFDSDDILKLDALYECLRVNYNYIRFYYENFASENFKRIYKGGKTAASGVFMISKELFDSIGGFQAWKCSADSEFWERGDNNSIYSKVIPKILMLRRKHDTSLTVKHDMKSNIRLSYKRLINKTIDWSIPVDTIKKRLEFIC